MLLLAPFAHKLVNYSTDSTHSEYLMYVRKSTNRCDQRKMSSISEFFIMFKDSLCRDQLTNVDAKGAKRSVKMWTANFYKNVFKNILLYMNGRLSKTHSVHTYVIPRTVYFDCFCTIIYHTVSAPAGTHLSLEPCFVIHGHFF